MRISKKGQYALRMMLDLAVNNTGEFITIKSISERQALPEKYLEQIMTIMSRAGFVKSVRGSSGGYKLSDKPENYTVGMILKAAEGSLVPAACLEEGDASCMLSQSCVVYDVWDELNKAINGVLDHITLAMLVQKQLAKAGYDYMI